MGIVVDARRAGVRHRRRWVFRELDVTVSAGDTVAVTGPPGSGRTTVLLALTGRLKLSAGSVSLGGTASLAYVPGVTGPEPVLTVAECVRERRALLGRSAHEPVDTGLDPQRRVWELSPYEKQLLGLALARVGEPAVIALDGVDIGLDADEQAAVWARVDDLAASGIAVIATTRTADPDRVTTVITLSGTGATDLQPDAAPDAAARDRAAAAPEGDTADGGTVDDHTADDGTADDGTADGHGRSLDAAATETGAAGGADEGRR